MSDQPFSRTVLVNLLNVFLLLVLIIAFIPLLDPQAGSDATVVKVAIPASPVPTTASTSPEPTPTPTTTPESAAQATQAVDVNVIIKQAATDEPAEESSAASTSEWQIFLKGRTAKLTLVVSNEGDAEIRPCLVIPAIYDANSFPVQFKIVAPASGAGGTATPKPASASDLCETGINARPQDFHAPGITIPPAGAEMYSLTLDLEPGQQVQLPYSGRVDVYIPGAPVDDEESLRTKPYLSLPFVIRSVPDVQVYATTWSDLRAQSMPVLTSLLELFAVLLVAAVLWLFGKPIVSSLVGDPGLSIDAITSEDARKGDAQKIKSLLQDELDNLRGSNRTHNFSPLVVTTPDPGSTLEVPSKLKEDAVISVLVNVLEYIFRPNTIKVTGHLQESKVKGLGLTVNLTLNRSGTMFDTQTFWEQDYSGYRKLIPSSDEKPFDAIVLLIHLAAAWISYKASARNGNTNFAPLGSKVWESHVYFVAAMHIYGLTNQGNAPEDARLRTLDLLNTSLDYDRNNPVAAINRALLNSELMDEEEASDEEKLVQYKLEYDRLEKVIQSLKAAVQREHEKLPALQKPGKPRASEILGPELWLYQALYNQATLCSLWANAAKEEPKTGEEKDSKRGTARAILTDLAERLRTRTETASDKDREIILGLQQAIASLRGVIEMDEEKKPDLDFAKKVAGASGNTGEIHYRAHYSIACYFSIGSAHPQLAPQEKADCFRLGFYHLRLALERRGHLNNIAGTDPDLKNLSEHDKEQFGRIVDRHIEKTAVQDDSSENLETILQILREPANVNTADELLLNGTDRAERQTLARLSAGKLSYEAITKWVYIADLMRATDGNETYATFLYQFADSPAELRTLDKKVVTSALKVFLQDRNLRPGVTAEQLISNWLSKADSLEQVVL